MKRKLSCLLCAAMLLGKLPYFTVNAENVSDSVFYEYIKRYEQAPVTNTYSSSFFSASGGNIEPNGNEGIVASKIFDFDNDGSNELIILLLNWNATESINSLDLIVIEKTSNYSAVEQSRVTLTDSTSCFSNLYINEDIYVNLYNNYIGYVYSVQAVEGTDITYKVCAYDGNNISTLVCIYNPGYTSGVAIYDVSDCKKEKYYNEGILLYSSGAGADSRYSLYDSYDAAISNKMSPCAITTYSDNYSHITVVPEDSLLCHLHSDGHYNNNNYKSVTSTYTFISYSDIGQIANVILNGNKLSFDQPPVIVNGRVLVPLRAIFEAMGANVAWENTTKTATVVKDSTTIKATIGSSILYKNGEQIPLDVPPQLINDYTMVPVRAVAEAFGSEVTWDNDTYTVTIKSIGNSLDSATFLSIASDVGIQQNGNSEQRTMCSAYCVAYIRSYYDNTAQNPYNYWGAGGTQWGNGGGANTKKASEAELFLTVKTEIDNGRPCIIHVKGTGKSFPTHYVVVFGYSESCSSISNLITIDPWDGKVYSGSALEKKFALYSDNQIITFTS